MHVIKCTYLLTKYLWPLTILSIVNILLNPPPPPTTFTYRCIKSIDYSKFISNLNAFLLIKIPQKALTGLLALYFSTLSSLLDCYSLLLTKTNRSSRSSPTPWITPDILNPKSARRHLNEYTLTLNLFLTRIFYALPPTDIIKELLPPSIYSTSHSSAPLPQILALSWIP